MTLVVDASAVLAWLQDEAGADEAEPMLMEGVIGAANWSEVLKKARQHGVEAGTVAMLLASFGLKVVEVTAEDAERAARLWRRGAGLSLADRLCLALGLRLEAVVATADSRWATVDSGPEVRGIR
ncbi:MAG TPA: type II toxin-antitoxin system VapC family toxin [Candidatus Limnocylindria bacterium]|nr:type II toxin-antitoxin system VapC family toxin [Candidatus Limnocylindria bacterium]